MLALKQDREKTDTRIPSPDSDSQIVLRMKLAGANRNPQMMGLEELPGKINYFTGSDPKK